MIRRDFLAGAAAAAAPVRPYRFAVLISANAEWKPTKALFPGTGLGKTPYGEWFQATVAGEPVLFVHGGWGKMAAAGSTQYVIDHWNPAVLLNLGTCGGMEGAVKRGATVLAERTVVYDIVEMMGDAEEAISERSVKLDLSWLGGQLPYPVVKTTLVSADRDLDPADVERLRTKYGAVAADWESGSIAYVAQLNRKRVVILRVVTDLVSKTAGEIYGDASQFQDRAGQAMGKIIERLPGWLAHCRSKVY